jgi:hypothetical protein
MTGTPLIQPHRVGDACWDMTSVAMAIRIIAQVDPSKADWFLASHAPIRHLLNLKTERQVTEAEAFGALVGAKDREVEAIVRGEPGTGKSHFINWLKLRFDDALRRGELTNLLPILIQRRTGSLKDALDQLVSQLPEQFAQYLDPIKAAISSISAAEARQRLAHFLWQELGTRWQQSGRAPRDRRLRALDEVFTSTGFRQWLCRDDGPIAANIRRLTSPSDVRDRESVPLFTEADFLIADPKLRNENTPTVMDLIITLDDDPRWRQEAAHCVNGILRDAMRRMTGLGDRQLTDIFRRIRTDLRALGSRLVLFIEDVSTLSVLDNEIINALEPQNDSALCPLTSVIGMTNAAYERLRDNEKQRATVIWSLGSSQDSQWRSDSSSVDRFVARYLNTVRLAPEDVHLVAQNRLSGGDVDLTACDECRIKKGCHATFGSVDFSGAVVGLFPLRSGSAGLLLEQLDPSRDGVERTPRGLLVNILEPLLAEIHRSADGSPTTLKLPVRVPQPTYWTLFENQFCGDWTPEQRSRARTLAVFWAAQAKDADSAADALSPLLATFGLPSLGTRPRPKFESRPPEPEPALAPAPVPRDTKASDTILQALRTRLEVWLSGEKLTTPRDCQELLLGLLKNSLPLEETHRVSRAAKQLIREATTGAIWIEDVMTRSIGVYFAISFLRNHETTNLILALAHFRHAGGNSWSYPDGEIHKRIVSTWVRQYSTSILATLNEAGVEPRPPLQSSARFLALAFMAVHKKPLPLESSEAIEALMKLAPTDPPKALSKALTSLYQDLPVRIPEIKSFLQLEMDVPQGWGGTLFIDPTSLLDELPAMRRAELPEPLDGVYLKSYSLSRYSKLGSLIEGPWSKFGAALDEERKALADAVAPLVALLSREGLNLADLRADVGTFVDKALEMRRAVKDAGQVIPCPAFDEVAPSLGLKRESIGLCITEANRIANDGDVKSVLCFDASEFEATRAILLAIAEFFAIVRRQVAIVTQNEVSMEQLSAAARDTKSALQEFLNVVRS